MGKSTKICKHATGFLFTFLPIEVVQKLEIKAGDRFEWKILKDRVILRVVKKESSDGR